MDTEKYLTLQKKIREGLSPTDEGPFYHHSWWESYKGSIKGKLGGIVIGALMGAVLGGIVAGIMATGALGAAAASLPLIGLAFAGLTGAGILYGAHEFSDIGKTVGAQAAGLEQMDAREAVRFSVIEKKIDALANALKAKGVSTDRSSSKEIAQAEKEVENMEVNYRKTHYARLNGSTQGPIFWKIALIGLAVGVAAGLILATGGSGSIAAHTLATLGLEGLSHGAVTAISAAVFGMFGASFGINRDVFRRIFDVTDVWSKGLLSHKKVREHQTQAGLEIEKKNGYHEAPEVATVTTGIAQPNSIEYPISSTYHRDRLREAAERALLSFDHTRATPQ